MKSIQADNSDDGSPVRHRLDPDGELFDKEVAAHALVKSEHSKLSLNPLFLNTRQFNTSTNEYDVFKRQSVEVDSQGDADANKNSRSFLGPALTASAGSYVDFASIRVATRW